MRKKGSIRDIINIKEEDLAKTALKIQIAQGIGHRERTKNIVENIQGQAVEKDMESIGSLQVLLKGIIKSTVITKRLYIINGSLLIWNHIEVYLIVLQIALLICKGHLLLLMLFNQLRWNYFLKKVGMILSTNKFTLDLL